MEIKDIQQGLSQFVVKYDSQTFKGSFRDTTRDSLLKDGLSTRANSLWKMAEYVIASYDNNAAIPISQYINGWLTLASKQNDQILFIEENINNWGMYDAQGTRLGGEDYILQFFSQQSKIQSLLSSPETDDISELFATYLKNEGKSEATIDRYVKQVPNNSEVQNVVQSVTGTTVLFDVMDVAKLLQISQKVAAQDFDQKGGNMYSAGINAFAHFVSNYYLFLKYIARNNKNTLVHIPNPSNHPLQQIFYGAPGTGKSNTIKREVEDQGKIHFRTTFHPDSDYSTFVGCYKPTLKSVKKTVVIGQDEKEVKPLTGGTDSVEQISYQFVPQAFTKAYCEAWNHYNENEESEPVYLIIEEINRGNCAQIFGDIFQLLDRKNGFSEYPIDADEDLKKFLLNGTKDDGTPWLVNKKGIENGQLCLPANLHIWATMNTSDQSLFPIDSAFKRRWDWKYIPIDYNKETWSIVAKGASYSWSDFLKKMNNLVASTTDSEDKMLGFYFAKAKDGIIDADTFVGKVVFYLWNDVFKDYGLPKEILNGAESKEFAFRNFFNVDGSANEDVVKRLLDNLEIKIAGSNENETYIENDDIDAGKAEHKETLVAVTINGERLTADDITQFDLYLNAIKKIGVNRIGPALEAMKYRRKGSPMATKDPVQSLLESDNYSYVKVDGYYFVKGANGYTLVRILEDLNTSLNLNIQIEYR